MFTAIARLLVQCNSSVNPMVYASTVPEFKYTLRKMLFKTKNARQSLLLSQDTRRTTLRQSQVRNSRVPEMLEDVVRNEANIE